MYKKLFFKSILLLTILIISGCTSSNPSTQEIVVTPNPGKSIIYGTILNSDKSPKGETVVRLAKVYHATDDDDGTFVLDEANSPSTISEDNGQFSFVDIDPGEYVIFVGQFHTDYMIVSDSEQNPNVYEVGPDEILEVEPIIFLID
jgi:hypothetical protein